MTTTSTAGARPRDQRAGRRRAAAGLLLVLLLGALARTALRRRRATDEAPGRAVRRDEVLHYAIPRGQDPAAAASALRVHGYAVHLHEERVDYEVEIRAGDGGHLDREQVRRVLQRSSLDLAGGGALDDPVRFTDEEPR